MLRVDFDELDEAWSHEAGGYICVYQGEPFTGIAFDLTPAGNLRGEVEFKNGVWGDGFSREWYDTGEPKEESFYPLRGVHSYTREWFSSGQIMHEIISERGITVKEYRWDTAGQVTYKFELNEQDALLQIRRRDAGDTR